MNVELFKFSTSPSVNLIVFLLKVGKALSKYSDWLAENCS